MSFESKLLDAMCDVLPTQDNAKISAFCRQLIDIAGREHEGRANAWNMANQAEQMRKSTQAQLFALHDKIEKFSDEVCKLLDTTPMLELGFPLSELVTKFLGRVSNGTDYEV